MKWINEQIEDLVSKCNATNQVNQLQQKEIIQHKLNFGNLLNYVKQIEGLLLQLTTFIDYSDFLAWLNTSVYYKTFVSLKFLEGEIDSVLDNFNIILGISKSLESFAGVSKKEEIRSMRLEIFSVLRKIVHEIDKALTSFDNTSYYISGQLYTHIFIQNTTNDSGQASSMYIDRNANKDLFSNFFPSIIEEQQYKLHTDKLRSGGNNFKIVQSQLTFIYYKGAYISNFKSTAYDTIAWFKQNTFSNYSMALKSISFENNQFKFVDSEGKIIQDIDFDIQYNPINATKALQAIEKSLVHVNPNNIETSKIPYILSENLYLRTIHSAISTSNKIMEFLTKNKLSLKDISSDH